ncbi:hypothetical protein B4110_1496 [Parageobacillus toebii]|uniref:Uncharacterized protein n=1 Tax=Parageobacillus toebii TaxID=153151 RepID=A0A150N7B8_9BACL|nr:hypothetical protein B4110_1496 [Parageobacillus toebii]
MIGESQTELLFSFSQSFFMYFDGLIQKHKLLWDRSFSFLS